MIRTVFIGTPDFAVPSLNILAKSPNIQLLAVITQPDMPAGRGLELKSPAVKRRALALGLDVWQPTKISQCLENLESLKPDLIVVAAYAQIIPESILKLPTLGCLNVHGSLLPRYRGAGVVQAAIFNGDKETGVTIMLMDKGLDTGPLLSQAKLTISPHENAGQLMDRLADLGARLLLPTILAWSRNEIEAVPQDNSQANYVGMIKKADGLIDWTKPAKQVETFVRAMSPWPGAWTWMKGQQLKIIEANPQVLPLNTAKPGKLLLYNNYLAVQCGEDALIIERLKLSGRQETSGAAFINGHREALGQILG